MGHFTLNATTVPPALVRHWLNLSSYEELSLATVLFLHRFDLIFLESGTLYSYPWAKMVCWCWLCKYQAPLLQMFADMYLCHCSRLCLWSCWHVLGAKYTWSDQIIWSVRNCLIFYWPLRPKVATRTTKHDMWTLTWATHYLLEDLATYSSRSSRGKIMEWIAIFSYTGPRFVTTVHCNLSVLGGPECHGS